MSWSINLLYTSGDLFSVHTAKLFRLGEEVCRKKSNIRQVWKTVQKGQENLSSDSATTHVGSDFITSTSQVHHSFIGRMVMVLLSVSKEINCKEYKQANYCQCDGSE